MRNYFLFPAVLSIGLMLGCSKSSSENNTTNQQTSIEPSNDLPAMIVTTLDGSQVDIRTMKGKIILILFQPDCDHCQREAEEIRKHIDAFKDYTLYFISADQLPVLEAFGKKYELLNYSNIHFASTSVESVLNNFGPISAPSLYIYSDQKLIQKFNGEVSIEKILGAI
jgi:peroxiredoxin